MAEWLNATVLKSTRQYYHSNLFNNLRYVPVPILGIKRPEFEGKCATVLQRLGKCATGPTILLPPPRKGGFRGYPMATLRRREMTKKNHLNSPPECLPWVSRSALIPRQSDHEGRLHNQNGVDGAQEPLAVEIDPRQFQMLPLGFRETCRCRTRRARTFCHHKCKTPWSTPFRCQNIASTQV